MNNGMIAIMLSVSLFIGFLGLVAFIWGLRTGQFDDEKKMMQGVLFDSEEDLVDASKRDEKLKKEDREDAKDI